MHADVELQIELH